MFPALLGVGAEITAYDLDATAVKEMIRTKGWDDVDFLENDDMLDAIEDHSFDVILCLDVLEHVDDLGRHIERFRRLLRTDGVLVLSGPTESLFYRIGRAICGFKGDYHVRNVYDIESLLSDQFSMKTRKKLGWPITLSSNSSVPLKVEGVNLVAMLNGVLARRELGLAIGIVKTRIVVQLNLIATYPQGTVPAELYPSDRGRVIGYVQSVHLHRRSGHSLHEIGKAAPACLIPHLDNPPICWGLRPQLDDGMRSVTLVSQPAHRMLRAEPNIPLPLAPKHPPITFDNLIKGIPRKVSVAIGKWVVSRDVVNADQHILLLSHARQNTVAGPEIRARSFVLCTRMVGKDHRVRA